MPRQHDLQKTFGNYLCGFDDKSMRDHLKSPKFLAKEILALHRNNFTLTLTEALATMFPAIKALIGEDCFDAHAGRFIEKYPPSNPVLSTYGKGFADYLDGQLPLSVVAYLGDVARLEWAWNEAFHSADAEPLTQYELAQSLSENGDGLEFGLHPSLRLASSPYPLLNIWRYAKYQDNYPKEPDLLEGRQHVLIMRPQAQVIVIPVDPGTYAFLHTYKKSSGFTEALIAAQQSSPTFLLEDVLPPLLVQGAFISTATNSKDNRK